MPRPSTTLFEDAIDVLLWLENDRLTPYAERVRRDREIGQGIAQRDAVERVRRWWRQATPAEAPGAGARLARLRALVTVAMAGIGALTGVAVALAAFAYDGTQPVNVVRLLALVIGVPLVLLALTLLLLPGRVPGLGRIQDLLAALNPGAWAAGVFGKLARAWPDAARLFDRHAAQAAYRRFAKWQLVIWSQTAAVAFNVAVLAAALVLVTFSDLAFGWSTTLETNPQTVTRWMQAIAWPWHAVAPQALPSATLVEQSQFFRLNGGDVAAGSPRVLGAWWPFIVLAIVTYGLIPRLALLALAAARLRAATKAVLLDDGQVTALLDRMTAPAVETAAAAHELAPRLDAGAAPAKPGVAGRAQAVVWEGCLPVAAAADYARRHLGLEVEAVTEAGGGRALAEDRAALERLAANAARTLVVFTPAWEPPLLELMDFLGEVRRRVGAVVSIVVTPVPHGDAPVSEVERATWARAVARLADPKVYVETGAP